MDESSHYFCIFLVISMMNQQANNMTTNIKFIKVQLVYLYLCHFQSHANLMSLKRRSGKNLFLAQLR